MMEYKVESGVSPDGIKLHVVTPYWVETYDELIALIKSLDTLQYNPEAKIVVQEKKR